jgi:hypothetical protein
MKKWPGGNVPLNAMSFMTKQESKDFLADISLEAQDVDDVVKGCVTHPDDRPCITLVHQLLAEKFKKNRV